MDDLVKRAMDYASHAHTRINHRRKYTNQPYTAHLAAVARRITEIDGDAEMIAAAWLHDVVEDTEATLYDIEQEFGETVAALVEDLTDVSKPSDGNRATRKALDRAHLAGADARAKTVKLADLIDNALDICRNDQRFARVYLDEMAALLEVLQDGDARLLQQAHEVLEEGRRQLERAKQRGKAPPQLIAPPPQRMLGSSHVLRLFTDSFTAQDITEPLRSFDVDKPCEALQGIMDSNHLDVVGLRENGVVVGYVRRDDLCGNSLCGDHLRPFRQGQIIAGDSTLSDVIHVLTLHTNGFISLLGEVVGIVGRNDINKPVVRMWLFGMITFIEMEVLQMIEDYYPDDSWQTLLSEGRLEKARHLQQERLRRSQQCRLLDCLQMSDKGQILGQNPSILNELGLESRGAAKRVVRELESLRNNLAHAQDIVTYDWAPIARLSYRLEETLHLRRPQTDEDADLSFDD